MARAAEQFVCQACGALHRKWSGRCGDCGEWNTVVAEAAPLAAPRGLDGGRGEVIDFQPLAGSGEAEPRTATGIAEFDRACGGGLVAGSAVLIGGDPGIGKSTLVLQVVAALSRRGVACLYVSGEEAPDQIRLRARRLGLGDAGVELAAATSVRDVRTSLAEQPGIAVIVVDSIQTMYVDSVEAAPGTVSQVRASAQELIRLAKGEGFTLLLVGHVTKEGQIAGPRVLEHMVDTVLYFEGERGLQFRILRAVKNRFGASDEIGVFAMTDRGLEEVPNPSALFLADRAEEVSGAAVFAGIEGSRPLLVEVQALVAPSPLATPRRAAVGWDGNRLAMVMAVLDARCGLTLAGHDVYLNIAGGLRVSEPAVDLAVAAALVSAATGTPVPAGSVVFGEIALSGEVRPVSQSGLRLKEAAKLGFERALVPRGAGDSGIAIAATEIARLGELVELLAAARP